MAFGPQKDEGLGVEKGSKKFSLVHYNATPSESKVKCLILRNLDLVLAKILPPI